MKINTARLTPSDQYPTAILVLLLTFCLLPTSLQSGERSRSDNLRLIQEKLPPLHKQINKPGPQDWLANHDEPGQSLKDYQWCKPNIPGRKRKIIYIQPLGDFSAVERKIIDQTVSFTETYFGLKVKVKKDIPLSTIPPVARRKNPHTGQEQILTMHILDKVLFPRLPEDAIAYLAFTASDLWPGEGWNFVYGQAAIYRRVGVWSIHRNGNPEGDSEDYQLCLLRTIKTGTHETGHMFSLFHCKKLECNLNGSNNRAESDSKPLWLCPECLAKLCWGLRFDPVKRYWKLHEICHEFGLHTEADFYARSAGALVGFGKEKCILDIMTDKIDRTLKLDEKYEAQIFKSRDGILEIKVRQSKNEKFILLGKDEDGKALCKTVYSPEKVDIKKQPLFFSFELGEKAGRLTIALENAACKKSNGKKQFAKGKLRVWYKETN